MSFSPIDKIESTAPVRDESSWVDQYKEAFVEHQHDTSQLTLILPDDCLVVVGRVCPTPAARTPSILWVS